MLSTEIKQKPSLKARTSLKPKIKGQQSKHKKSNTNKKHPKKTESILHQKDGTCFLCMLLHSNYIRHSYIEEHHIFFGTANRKLSEEFGLKVYTCMGHHRGDINGNKEAVHSNREIDLILKREGQKAFEQTNTREEFMKIFGANYLEWEESV